MEIKIKKEDLLKTLTFTQNVVEKKSTMPILANVLIEVVGKRLKVSATDLEVGISVDCPAEVFKAGRVTVFARGLYDIIKELPDQLIHIKMLDNNWLAITCGKSKFKIVGMSAEEFPSMPACKEGVVYTEAKETIQQMIAKTQFAMSNDETRYNLNGICLQSVSAKGHEGIRMVATDGHRLSLVDRESKSKWKIGKGAIIPRKGIMELKKLLEAYEGDFTFKIDEKNISVEKENVQLVIRLIDGQFPPYEQVIPKENKRVVSIDKALFVKALRRVSLLASEKTKGVKFSISPGHVEVSTSDPDRGEAQEEMEAAYKGETFSVGFNSRYFLDVLDVLADEKVVMEFKDDVSPCIIRSEMDRNITNVIMPMRM